MKPAIEWINEVGETVAIGMFTEQQPPGGGVEELVKRIQADARAELEAERDARMAAILAIIGGTVEGSPTSEVNFLQRLRELAAQSQSKPHRHVNNGVDDACKVCGLDLRNEVHIRAQPAVMRFAVLLVCLLLCGCSSLAERQQSQYIDDPVSDPIP